MGSDGLAGSLDRRSIGARAGRGREFTTEARRSLSTQRWLRREERTTEGAEHTEGIFLVLRQQVFLCVV